MSKLSDEDFWETDRVELSGYFDVYAHGKGIQLVKEDRTYSIVPLHVHGIERKQVWEVNNDENQFSDLHKAISYVLKEEGVKVTVQSVKEFYNIEEASK